jgi:hypothetical protein
LVEGPEQVFGVDEDGDRVRLETGTGNLAGFELPSKRTAGREFLFG